MTEIEQSSITSHEGKRRNRLFSVQYPKEFFNLLDRCIKLKDVWNEAVEFGKMFQPDEHKLAADIRRYFEKKVPTGTLRDWIKPLNEEWRKRRLEFKKQKLSELRALHAQNIDKESFEYRVQIYHGDIVEQSQNIETNSIRLIFTDPPYPEEYLYLYEELANVASRVLEDGGILITYAGHMHLDKVFQELGTKLNYYWTFCVKHEIKGQTHGRPFKICWKPMLMYVKGDLNRDTIKLLDDLIESKKPDKTLHEWAQSPIEAEYIIEHLTLLEDQIILDPFMGDGTTGIASLNQKRKFIGIELDNEKFTNAENALKARFNELYKK